MKVPFILSFPNYKNGRADFKGKRRGRTRKQPTPAPLPARCRAGTDGRRCRPAFLGTFERGSDRTKKVDGAFPE